MSDSHHVVITLALLPACLPTCVPHHSSLTSRRGKHNLEHFTVFVAEVSAEHAAGFKIKLSKESREWRWIAWSDVLLAASGRTNTMELHPVVAMLASKHADAVTNAVKSCPAIGGRVHAPQEGSD